MQSLIHTFVEAMMFQHIDIALHGTVRMAKLLICRITFTFFILLAMPPFFRKYHLFYFCFLKYCKIVFAPKSFVKTMAANVVTRIIFLYPLTQTAYLRCIPLLFHYLIIHDKLILISGNKQQKAKLYFLVEFTFG